MEEWLTIAILLLCGIVLLVIEMIFIPGTTVVGIAGVLSIFAGIYFSFDYFGTATGWYVTGGTLAVLGIATYFSFKTGVWMKFALKKSIDSKVNEGLLDDLEVGQEGVCISVLKPIGIAEFGEKVYEVTSLGGYIREKVNVRIIKIQDHKVFVEPINN